MDYTTLPTQRLPPKRGPRWLIWARRLIVYGIVAAILGGIAMFIGIIWLSQDLPAITKLDEYRPVQATVVYGRKDDKTGAYPLVARFAKERRTVIDFEKIPKVMIDAMTSAEDAEFFKHGGIDYLGIVRCAFKNLVRRRAVCGASTITQQTAKTFLLTREKSITRKAKELILARRMERTLEKEDILFLYLNQIYFGHGAYGVEEASRVYFGKSVDKLNVTEAALLAGLPQSPSRLDPYRHSERAIRRRAYVLGRMRALNKIDEKTYQEAMESPLDLVDDAETDLDSNNHYAAYVRSLLPKLLKPEHQERLAKGGLQVYTGMDPRFQREAKASLREGLRRLDKRQGWRGPIDHLERAELKEALQQLAARVTAVENKAQAAANGKEQKASDDATKPPRIWDLSRLEGKKLEKVEEIVAAARLRRFVNGAVYAGPVVAVDDNRKIARVDLGGVQVVIPRFLKDEDRRSTGFYWARPFNTETYESDKLAKVPSEVLKLGDIVWVRPIRVYTSQGVDEMTEVPVYAGHLEQTPSAEAAMVSIDPHTREVRALVGGFGIGAGAFNRAIQAKRQPGSTFKPFVYAAAFATEKFSPTTICVDKPEVVYEGKKWAPKNYGGDFEGDLTLRKALTKSKNLCSVQLLKKVGPDKIIDMATRAGIKSKLPKWDAVALGSGDVQPLEIVNAYTTLSAGGVYGEPIFVSKIVDSLNGEVLYEKKYTPERKIRADVAYLIVSLMQSVVQDGTAKAVKSLGRPVAGKTGTTNEARDAWFIGFTPDLVAGVWVGFDDNVPLGSWETGGRAAIPIWLGYMREATKDTEPKDFLPPPNVVFVEVDPTTGKLPTVDFDGQTLNEAFIAGTEPKKIEDISQDEQNRLLYED